MIFDRLTLFRALFRRREAAGPVVARWAAAAEREPELVADVIRVGGVLAALPARYADGVEVSEPFDPIRFGRIQGRRELALDLLAMMTIGGHDLQRLMENDDAD